MWALPKLCQKLFFCWIQTGRFRPRNGIVFGTFLTCLGPPCRCVSLAGRVGPAQPSPIQPTPIQRSPAKPSPGQPSPAQVSPAQVSPAQPSQPSQAQTQASPLAWAVPRLSKGFLLLDSDGLFSAPKQHRFWSVWGRRTAAFPCFEGVALGLRFGSS